MRSASPRWYGWWWVGAIAVLALLAWWRLGIDSLEGHPGPDRSIAPARVDPVAVNSGAIPVEPDPSHEVRPPKTAFEGRVVSAVTGQGVDGAEMTFSRAGEATLVTASPDGRFRFEPPLSGRWTLATVFARGYLPFAPEWGHSPVVFDALPGVVIGGIVVTLRPEDRLLGRVIGPSGKPVPGAEIRLLTAATGQTALMPVSDRFTADAAGEFRFVAPDEAVLEARHPGFVPVRARVDFGARVSHRLVLAFRERIGREERREPETIRGMVLTIGDKPAGGALVEAWPEGTDGLGGGQVVAGADGRFEIEGLRPGNYRVTASTPHLAPAVSRDVPAGTEDLQLYLWLGGHIAGHVRQRGGGQPVKSFTMAVQPRGQGWRSRTVRSVVDPQGAFDLDGLFPGPSILVVTAPDHAPLNELPLMVPGPREPALELDLELSAGGRVQGSVLERRTRRRLAGATVEVEVPLDPSSSAMPVGTSAVTGAEGTFELAHVPEHAISLRVSAPRHHGRVVAIPEATEGAVRTPPAIELAPSSENEPPYLELVDIGADLVRRGDVLSVESVFAGSGAGEVGLEPGDLVDSIDGRPVAGLSQGEASSLLRGLENSPVTLTIHKAGDPPGSGRPVTIYRRARPNG